MKRALIPALIRPSGDRRGELRQEGGPGRRAARGLRRRRRPEGRPDLPGARRPDEGLPGRRDPGPRRGLPRTASPSPRARSSRKGAPPLPDRPASRSRRPSPTRRRDLATAQARLEKANNDVTRLRPWSQQQAVSQQELDNALVRAGRGPRPGGRRRRRRSTRRPSTSATRASRRRSTASWARPRSRPATSSAAARARCSRRSRRSIRSSSAPASARPSTCGSPSARRRAGAGGRAETAEIELTPRRRHAFTRSTGRVDADRARGRPDHRHARPCSSRFPNPERVVRPGQYGRARFVIETKTGALLVPQRAVQELQNLYSVAVVGADNKVEFRNVKVGPRVDSLWVIEEGLKPGEKVVVEGLQKVRDGAVVEPEGRGGRPRRQGCCGAGDRGEVAWPASSSTDRSWRW